MKRRVISSVIFSILILLLSTGCLKLNSPPVFSDIPDQSVKEGDTLKLNLSEYVLDPDGNELTFKLLYGVGKIISNTYRFNPGYEASGTYNVEIEASDSWGGNATDTFMITVIDVNRAPVCPMNPFPADDAIDVSHNPILSWNCIDPDGDPIKFDVYFGTNPIPIKLVATDISLKEYNPGILDVHKTYYWKIIAKDNRGIETEGDIWSFSTANRVPKIDISDQSVNEGETLTLDLTEYATDLDNDTLIFTILNGVGTITDATYTYSPDYEASGTYNVEIEASDGWGGNATDTFVITVTDVNRAPLSPADPSPANDEVDVSLNPTLSWSCSDPDGDSLSYDVYFGTSASPTILIANTTNTIFNPGELDGNTVYYWKIIAHDNFGGMSEGSLWSFKTTVFKWKYQTGYRTISSPAIGNDGTVYVGSRDNYLHAINPDGTVKWKFEASDDVDSSPAIGNDGTIYIGSYDGHLYAVSPEGTQVWKFEFSGAVNSSPAIGPDGTIYIGSLDNNLYAINPDGTKKWSFATSGGVDSSPSIGADGTIYVGSNDFNLYAISPDGTLVWIFQTGNLVHSSPAIGSDGTIYVGSYDGKLYAINPDGTKKWEFRTGDRIYSSPAIGVDSTIYIGSLDGKLYAINPDGTKKWEFSVSDFIYSSPAIGADGTIYVRTYYAGFYAINADGTKKWEYLLGDYVYSSPVISNNGTIYVGVGWFLYALKGNSGGPANSDWPMFRHDEKHTGMVPVP
ncbi:outer membrane protein assembly factor BamB family protein [Kosmotoga arenicorallina]|nr:PQQ-binding-like beta-propeller repeat protein [Kosmotoga arenicorallina]